MPAGVWQVLTALEAAGHLAVVVGGPVRDLLLGRSPPDWDVATSATPDRVAAVFPETRPTGIRHGTVTVLAHGLAVEVTTFRREGGYSDRRRPDWVAFTHDLRSDLGRRDFTVNAIAADRHGRLYDPFRGAWDLFLGRLRAVGDPGRRFAEDALRMLRAIRLSAQLQLRIDPATRAAIAAHAPSLSAVAAERIRDEFAKAVLSPWPAYALEMMRETGLLGVFAPELLEGVGVAQNEYHRYSVWEHALVALENTPPDLGLRLAALLHDIGKPRCLSTGPDGRRHFFDHERVGAEMAGALLRRLRFDHDLVARVTGLVRDHMALHHQPGMGDAAARRLLARLGAERVPDLIRLRIADRIASGTKGHAPGHGLEPLLEAFERVRREGLALKVSDLAIGGDEVMEVTGLSPGPAVGAILRRLLDEVLEDPHRNRPDYLRRRARELGGHPT